MPRWCRIFQKRHHKPHKKIISPLFIFFIELGINPIEQI